MTEEPRLDRAAHQAALAVMNEVLRDRNLPHRFQPLWHVPGGQLLGFEALARPPGGLPPDQLWSTAESTPWGIDLDLLSLETALSAGATLPGRLFVNVSARFLEASGGDRDRAIELLARYRPRLDTVVFEVTETKVSDPVLASAGARYWQEQGVLLAVDDAGTGDSVPERVVLLRPNFIKVDQGLTRAWLDGRPGPLLQWREWAERIGAPLIVEGVEHPDVLAALQLLGEFAVQGFAFGQPAPADQWTPAEIRAHAPMGRKPAPPSAALEAEPKLRLSAGAAGAWRRHGRVMMEQILAGARCVVIFGVVGGRLLLHPSDSTLALGAVGAAGVVWSVVAGLLALQPHSSSRRAYWGSAVDFLWTTAWIALTGGAASPYLALLLWQLLLAVLRLPLGPAVMAGATYAAVYVGLAGVPRASLTDSFLLTVGAAVWWNGMDKIHPRHVRDDVTGYFSYKYSLFLLDRSRRRNARVGVVVFEVDDVGRLRDRLGGGLDVVLEQLASVADQAFASRSMLVRYGPDTFLAFCPAPTLERLDHAALLLQDTVGRTLFAVPGATGSLRVTLNIGVAIGTPGVDPDHLVRQGLIALGKARRRPDHLWRDPAIL